MSRPGVSLAIRTLSSTRPPASQWVCRRCLATQSGGQSQTNAEIPVVASAPTDPSTYDPTLPASQRIGPDGVPYRLKRSDFILKKPFTAHPIPKEHLQHSTSPLLPPSEQAQRAETTPHKRLVGVVVSSGKMDKTVRVRISGQKWNKRIHKYFSSHTSHLVHDPTSSLQTGDVISLHKLRVSRTVHHVVAEVLAPFGKPLSERPPIPSPDERLAAYKEKRFRKIRRRALRVRAAQGDAEAIEELVGMGLDPGVGVEEGVGQSRGKGEEKAVLGKKGQKLEKGILPGGKKAVGKIGERAQENKGKEMKFREKMEGNLEELAGMEKGEGERREEKIGERKD